MQRVFLETSVLHASHDHFFQLFNSRPGIFNGFHWLMACDRTTDTKRISIRYLRRLSSLSKNDKDIPLLMHVLQIFFPSFQVGSIVTRKAKYLSNSGFEFAQCIAASISAQNQHRVAGPANQQPAL
jgi:hypothetical protein